MGDWTTLSIRDSTAQRFNQLKADTNEPDVPEMTADLFLNSLMDTLEAVEDGHYGEANDPLTMSDVDVIADQLADELEQLDSGSDGDVSGELADIRTEIEAIKSELRKVV